MKTEGKRDPIAGLIIPHHLLAKELINDTINHIEEKESYEMILLLGPNHFHADSNTFTTTESMVGGYNLATTEIHELIEKFPDILVDQTLIQNEHSIMDILPFISASFPNAKVIPLCVSSHFNEGDFEEKITFINDIFNSHIQIKDFKIKFISAFIASVYH